MSQVAYTSHDDLPAEETRIVDAGLDAANQAAAPLHEVRPMSCYARLASGEVVGGAVGRSWGPCCELQQLDAYNARDLGRFLVAFDEDVQVFRPPATEAVIAGKKAFGDFYATQRFCHEKLRAELLNRIVLGNRIIDHERITGVTAGAFEVAVVYEVSDGLIRRMWTYAKD